MEKGSGPESDETFAERFKRSSADDRRRIFCALYERHAGELRYYLLRMGRSPHLADDLTQEAFLRALDRLSGFSGRSSFKTWLFRIATNLLNDHMRRRQTVGLALDDMPSGQRTPAELAEHNEEAHRVRQAVDALPESLRAPLVLVRLEGMKYREAAEALGISLNALRMRVYRAHMALVAALRA